MRTSRPPGMGRRCAPRRQYRPPSGDPHPGDGAMASRPSRRSTTCSRRLRGSSGPRTRIWAPGGLDRQVYQIEISGKRAHAPALRDTWRSEDPGKSRKAVKAGRKNQGTVEVYLRNGCAGWGGGGRSLSRLRIPMFAAVSPRRRPRSAHRPIACTWLLRYGFGQETEGRWSVAVGDVAAMKGFPRLSPDPRHGRCAPSDGGLRAPCTRRPWLTRSQNPGFCVSEKDLAETG